MTDLNESKRLLLAEWEARRNELDVLIAALRREMGIAATEAPKTDSQFPVSQTPGISVNDLVRPGDFFGMSQIEAIQQFLSRTNRQPVSLQEIAAALYRGKATAVLIEGEKKLRNLSSGLSKSDTFYSVAKNRWGLAEWYPDRAIQAIQKDRKAVKPPAAPSEEPPNDDSLEEKSK